MPDAGILRSSMRFDPATGDWVLFAPSRLRRPEQLRTRVEADAAQEPEGTACPFCPGNERFTGPELFREPSSSPWSVRVIPNRLPALQIEESPRRVTDLHGFEAMGGCGAHEVLIESPYHDRLLHAQSIEQIERVLRAARSRYRDLMQDRRFQAIVIFKNHGRNAGTALSHPHWQIIATAVVPPLLRLKHSVATEHFDRTGECLYCDLTRRELEAAERVLSVNDDFAALLPYASHFPFETWILPRRHVPSYADANDSEILGLARTIQSTLAVLHLRLDNPDYTLSIDSVARGDEDKPYFLWHVRILPRLMAATGFELGSGMVINNVLPEDAARYLRASDRIQTTQ